MDREECFSNEVDMVLNTRRQGRAQSKDFYQRIAEAIANDLARERAEEEDVVGVSDDNIDAGDIVDERIASDEEEELLVEAYGQNDDEDDGNEDRLQLVIQQSGKNQPVIVSESNDISQEEITEPISIVDELIPASSSTEGIATDEAELSRLRELETQIFFIGKDGTRWNKSEPSDPRIRAHNIIRTTGGPTIRSFVPNFVFKNLITQEMATIIVKETNRKAVQVLNNYNAKNPTKERKTWTLFTETEFYAYLGVLIASGVSNNNFQHITELWNTKNLPIFRATLSLRRFLSISRFIRFDNGNTRETRLQNNKAAAISDIWLMLNANLQRSYVPHSCITVDEQLFPYRGRTRFTQFISSKPAKYGLKVFWACDSQSHYPLKGILYTGKNPDAKREAPGQQGERILMDLTSKYVNSGRTIIADNFFTSLRGCEQLMDANLAYVGTLRKNKKYVPPEFQPKPSRPIYSTEFGFYNNVAMCSYVPKKNRAVLLLSTVHYDKQISGETSKPDSILFYNKNKSGVDTMDQMLTRYTTKRRTKRWSLAFFYNIIDIATLASYIICNENENMKGTDARRNYMITLSELLVTPHIESRMNNPQVMKQYNTRSGIEAFFGKPIEVCMFNIKI